MCQMFRSFAVVLWHNTVKYTGLMSQTNSGEFQNVETLGERWQRQGHSFNSVCCAFTLYNKMSQDLMITPGNSEVSMSGRQEQRTVRGNYVDIRTEVTSDKLRVYIQVESMTSGQE